MVRLRPCAWASIGQETNAIAWARLKPDATYYKAKHHVLQSVSHPRVVREVLDV